MPEPKLVKSTEFLDDAKRIQLERAESRGGTEERSMEKIVQIFNIKWGLNLTEEQGWDFMCILKDVRQSYPGYREDDFTDKVSYEALKAEAARKERYDAVNPKGEPEEGLIQGPISNMPGYILAEQGHFNKAPECRGGLRAIKRGSIYTYACEPCGFVHNHHTMK